MKNLVEEVLNDPENMFDEEIVKCLAYCVLYSNALAFHNILFISM